MVIGTITGVIGALSGISGAILGFIAYRRSNEIKCLDLRVEVKKQINTAFSAYESASRVMQDANATRLGAFIFQNYGRSSARIEWTETMQKDSDSIEALRSKLLAVEKITDNLSMSDLEKRLVEAHRLQEGFKGFEKKYDDVRKSYQATKR